MDELLTKKEVCDLLKISYRHLTQLMKDGRIKFIDLSSSKAVTGKRTKPRFRKSDIEALISSV